MTKKTMSTCLGLALSLSIAISAWAANSVVVESKTVSPGAAGVPIRIRLTNDVPVQLLVVPLKIRSVDGGAYVSGLALSFSDRLTTELQLIRITNQYAEKNGTCHGTGPAFHVPVADSEGVVQPVTADPWGVIFAAAGMTRTSPMPPGADTVGSLILTVTVTDTLGVFEIDTACIGPDNVLMYVNDQFTPVLPSFQKGTITVAACDCALHGDLDGNGQIDGADLGLLIDWVYYAQGPPPTDASCPHIDRGDIDCSGADDASDIVTLSDYLYSGGVAPCDPCACTSYSTDCP